MEVADALHYLHTGASLVHRGLCPETVIITSSGNWKLAGLGLAAPLQLSAVSGAASPIFLPSIEGSWPARLQYLQVPPTPPSLIRVILFTHKCTAAQLYNNTNVRLYDHKKCTAW